MGVRLDAVAWPSDGLDGLIVRAQPSLLREGLPSAVWRAHALWYNTSYLATILPSLQVFVRRVVPIDDDDADRSFAFYFDGHKSDYRAHPMAMPKQSPVRQQTMSVDDVFAHAKRGEAALYASTDLKRLGAASVADVQPLAPYEHREHGAVSAHMWLSVGRAEACAHYDQSHNMYTQVVGRKRFYLWPPSAHDQLQFFPWLHSHQRQSSVPDPRAALAALGHELILEEGDALYIPPVRARSAGRVHATCVLPHAFARPTLTAHERQARSDAVRSRRV